MKRKKYSLESCHIKQIILLYCWQYLDNKSTFSSHRYKCLAEKLPCLIVALCWEKCSSSVCERKMFNKKTKKMHFYGWGPSKESLKLILRLTATLHRSRVATYNLCLRRAHGLWYLYLSSPTQSKVHIPKPR